MKGPHRGYREKHESKDIPHTENAGHGERIKAKSKNMPHTEDTENTERKNAGLRQSVPCFSLIALWL
jgi:hypothetical protein